MRTISTIFLFPVLLGAPATAQNVFFGTGGPPAEGLYRATFDEESGKLNNIERAVEIDRPGFLALHPTHEILYAIARTTDGPAVVAFAIDAEGELTEVNSQPIADPGPAHLAVHPSGKLLLTAQYSGGSIGIFGLTSEGQIRPDGKLIRHQGGSGVVEKRQNNPHPHWVGFSPDGTYALVVDLGLDQVVIYRVDVEKSHLEPVGTAEVPPGSGPRHMRFSTDGRTIYVLNELSLTVSAFSFDPKTGTTQLLSTTPTLSQETKAKESFNSASEILVHPNGKFLFTANRGHDSVTVFRIGEDPGELSVVETEPIRGHWPRHINLDPTGRWLLAAGARSNTVAVFEINQQTGELTLPRGRVFAVPNAICIQFKRSD